MLTRAPDVMNPAASRPGRWRHAHRKSARVAAPHALLDLFRWGGKQAAGGPAVKPETLALKNLLNSIERSERGLRSDSRAAVLTAVEVLAGCTSNAVNKDTDKLSATWRLLWTTEKETLFILQNARWFGTKAGEVYQVIDAEAGSLQNVITFPPEGAFIVDSSITADGPQRTRFQFTAARLRLPGSRQIPIPPFGSGWFDTIYVDDKIRVAQDSRGDTLVVAHDGPPRRFD